jgi:hypothetical protein
VQIARKFISNGQFMLFVRTAHKHTYCIYLKSGKAQCHSEHLVSMRLYGNEEQSSCVYSTVKDSLIGESLRTLRHCRSINDCKGFVSATCLVIASQKISIDGTLTEVSSVDVSVKATDTVSTPAVRRGSLAHMALNLDALYKFINTYLCRVQSSSKQL